MVDWQNWPLCLCFSVSELLSAGDSTLPARICSMLYTIKGLSGHFQFFRFYEQLKLQLKEEDEDERWATCGNQPLLLTIRWFKELKLMLMTGTNLPKKEEREGKSRWPKSSDWVGVIRLSHFVEREKKPSTKQRDADEDAEANKSRHHSRRRT